MTKTTNTKKKPKTKTSANEKLKQRIHDLKSVLIDIDDELIDLTEIMNFLPELKRFAVVMNDIYKPPSKDHLPTSADRIGICAHSLFNQSLDKHLTPSAEEFINQADTIIFNDMTELVEVIPNAVLVRLYRLQALVGMVGG